MEDGHNSPCRGHEDLGVLQGSLLGLWPRRKGSGPVQERRDGVIGKIFIVLISVLMSIWPFWAMTPAAGEPRWCPLCGMNLETFWKTNIRLTFADGTRTQTCSIFCATQIYGKRPAEIDRWEVVDYASHSFIEAQEAYWLIGSDIPGVMTAVSKIAFSSLDEAKKCQQTHGGTITPFDEALNRTLSNMAADREMIMARIAERAKVGKELAARHGCFRCHGEEGRGGSALGWNSPELAKKMDSRSKIKERIVKGSSGMPGYEGKIDERDLHSIALYIWSLRPLR